MDTTLLAIFIVIILIILGALYLVKKQLHEEWVRTGVYNKNELYGTAVLFAILGVFAFLLVALVL